MDFDDLLGSDAAPSKPVASRPSRFIPKSAKLKPKEEPQPDPPLPNKKEEPEPIQIKPDEHLHVKPPITESKPDETMAEADGEPMPEPMEEDHIEEEHADEEEEDQVVREIDVFFTPSPVDNNAQLYVLQYPLRPAWRPYEMDEKCKEVRVNPKNGKVEVDLSLDTINNYDDDVADNLRIMKQTLSSRNPPLTTSYAVGILIGNKLHLNPVHAVVQLRPSMEHLTPGRIKKTSATHPLESTSKKHGKLVESSTGQATETEESWISLNYHGMESSESSLSTRYRRKMISQESSKIPFSMSPHEYINSLCPGSSAESDGSLRLLKRSLLSLPLKERIEKWLSEGPQLNRFGTLMHLAPDHSDEDVLKILESCACLVQGLWISRTSLLRLRRNEAFARDYALTLFRNSEVVNRKQLEEYNLHKEAEPHLKEFAVYRPSSRDWKMKEPKDTSFISNYQQIVEEQKRKLDELNDLVMKTLQLRKKDPSKRNPSISVMNNITKSSANVDQGAKLPVNGTSGSRPSPMPDLPKAIETLFRKHNVCSLQFICQGLQEQGVFKADTAPLPEINYVVDQIATKIRDVYVLKSEGDPVLDPLRRVIIDLLGAKEPNAKLKKADIVEAAKIQLKKEFSTKDYQHVIGQICVSVKGNAWVLKSGDGNSKLNNLNIPNVPNAQLLFLKETPTIINLLMAL